MPILPVQEATKPEPVAQRPRPVRHVKAWVSISILLVLWVAALLIQHVLNTPAQGTVTQSPMIDTSQNSKQLIIVRGKKVTFQYPAGLQKVKPDSLGIGDIEKFLFSNPGHGSWSLAIQIKKLPGGVLAQNSDYNLRKQNPHQYIEQTITINGAAVSIMSDHSGIDNQVAFMTYNELVAEVALNGGRSSDAWSQSIFNTVLNSWHWL